MTPPRKLRLSGRAQAGFILPGVIMFIFVLTLIGLSLFALSSYEAQFMYASIDNSQAFYDASGAIDRARFLLGATKNLSSVGGMAGSGNVTYAVAKQGPFPSVDSLGPWTDKPDPILIRVLVDRVDSNNKHHRRFLEGSFDPNNVEQYDKLFSMSSTTRGLVVPDDDNSALQCVLRGILWQTYAGTGPFPIPHWHSDIYDLHPWDPSQDPAEKSNLFGPSGGEEVGAGYPPVPAPQVATFLATNFAAGVPPQEPTPDNYVLDASGAPDNFKYFSTSSLAVHGPGPSVEVHGTAVWMFSQGLHVDRTLSVVGTAQDMLVLCVKGPAASEDVPALLLDGGIDSPNVPVVLVSDHRIILDNNPNGDFNTSVNWLNVYAPSAWVWGPKEGTGKLLNYFHGTSPQAEASLEKLFRLRALPNVTGPKGVVSFRSGSWRDVTEPYPN